MTTHIVDLYGTPHAFIPCVLSPAIESTHHLGSELEAAIKRGELPPLAEFMPAIWGLPLGEQHYLMACYMTWANDAQFRALKDAVNSRAVSIPLELPLADANRITFTDESKEPEDRYDTFNYTPLVWRLGSVQRRGVVPAVPGQAPKRLPEGSPLYLWLDKASRSGLPDVEHAARVLKDYYEGVESTDPRSLTQRHTASAT